MAEEFNRSGAEDAFILTDNQTVVLEAFQHQPETLVMFLMAHVAGAEREVSEDPVH